jgi:hypothetical protein
MSKNSIILLIYRRHKLLNNVLFTISVVNILKVCWLSRTVCMGVNGLNPVKGTCSCLLLTLHQSSVSIGLEKSKDQVATALLTARRLVVSAGKWWDGALRYASPAPSS